jgi:hypothetical protein
MEVIKVCKSRVEADLIKSLLESEGIEVLISADDMGGLTPSLTQGVRVLVREDQVELALSILKQVKDS